MSDRIQPGAYARVTSGMYAGAEGRVVSLHVSASGPYATLDVGEAQPIAAYVSALELVGVTSTVEQERDDEIAHLRDELIDALEALNTIRMALDLSRDLDAADVCTKVQQIMSGVATRERRLVDGFVAAEQERDAAIAERDRLRFAVQQLRDRLRRGEDIRPEQVAEMLGDMLDGGES